MYLIDILPILLVAFFATGTRTVKPISAFNNDYLSVETGKNLRGLFSIVVIFHHLAFQTQEGILFRQFENFGILSVSVFFFLSGFGLQKSYMSSENYKKRFLLRRIPQVLFPYIAITAMYAILFRIYSIKQILLAIIQGFPIVDYSWYVISIIIFYFAFWILMETCKNNYFAMIIGACIYQVLYSVFCIKMGYPSFWYNSSYLLIFGMFWAVYEKRILEIVKKRYGFFSVIAWLGFLISFILKHNLNQHMDMISLVLTMLATILFVFCVLLFSMKVKSENLAFSFIGKISLEVYLVQGIFIRGFHSNFVHIKNETVYSILTVLCCLIFGTTFHFAFDKVLSEYKKMIK